MKVVIGNGAIEPTRATEDSAGYDLCALEDGKVMCMNVSLIMTGLRVEIPKGHAGFVCSRSGLALKKKVFVINAPGIIDADYRGDVGIILFNCGIDPFEYKAGDRIAQLLIVPVKTPHIERIQQLSLTDRGEGGFGSTGINQVA